ncbi:MAG: hypothetical protein ACI9CF_001197 [Candidatus Omnitrophota bacterium]|jgi:hypothetical protein
MKKILALSLALASFTIMTPQVWSADQVDSAAIGYQLGYSQGQVEQVEGIESQDPKIILDSPMFQGGYQLFANEYGLNDSEFRESYTKGFHAGYAAQVDASIPLTNN